MEEIKFPLFFPLSFFLFIPSIKLRLNTSKTLNEIIAHKYHGIFHWDETRWRGSEEKHPFERLSKDFQRTFKELFVVDVVCTYIHTCVQCRLALPFYSARTEIRMGCLFLPSFPPSVSLWETKILIFLFFLFPVEMKPVLNLAFFLSTGAVCSYPTRHLHKFTVLKQVKRRFRAA